MKDIISNKFPGRRPGFAERWALIVFLLILSTLFAAAWFVKYPEQITLDATLSPGYYVKAALHHDSLRNIQTGQKVQVRFEAYPFTEFGYVEGRLKQITELLHDRVELVIELPNGLETNRHRSIVYNEGMKAQVLIVVNDGRLLQRIYKSSFHLVTFAGPK